MLTSVSTRCTLLFIVTSCMIIALQNTAADQDSHVKVQQPLTPFTVQRHANEQTSAARQRRAIRQPGLFWVLGSSIFQQFNETKSAFYQIRNLLNDQFVDERKSARTKTPTTTPAPNVTTTEAPYRITRREFNKIIMRNLRGLARLYNLELNAALKQSDQNRAEFNKQLRYSIKQQLS